MVSTHPPENLLGQRNFQVKNPLAVVEIVKFYQEGGGDVWDKMDHALTSGGSQSPPVPGTAQSAHPGVPKSMDDSVVHTVNPEPMLHKCT